MEDREIIDLYWERNEQAIQKTAEKYGAYCTKISMNILNSYHDSEECVNDTFLHTWRAIPPNRPVIFSAFIGRITRNLAINKYKARHADKRSASEFALSLDELDDCAAVSSTVEAQTDSAELSRRISEFLRAQPDSTRRVFVRRYFFCESISEIASSFNMSESKVKSILFRTRKALKRNLQEGCIEI